jgi:hypothetical protein
MSCTHSKSVPGRWVKPTGWWVEEDDPDEWEPESSVSTTVDIDLHRYKCTQCGEVMYYSERARKHYEGVAPDNLIEESAARYAKKIAGKDKTE